MRTRAVAAEAGVLGAALAETWATRSLGGPYSLLAASVAAGALVLRRRLPLVAFAATLPALSLGYIWLAPMVALWTIAQDSRSRTPVTWCCAATVAGVSFYPWPWLGPVDWSADATVLAALMSALLATAPTALGLLTASRRELARGRERELRLAAQQAIVRERTRLARDMHDTVAHHLSLIALRSGALEVTAADEASREAAGAVHELSREAMDELRRMVGLLRLPAVEEVAGEDPGLAQLPALIASAGPGVRADIAPGALDECPPRVQHVAYRAVQEALTNVRKHAPGAEAEVVVRHTGRELLVSVRNGPVEPPAAVAGLPSGGHGLTGLRERAAHLGGTMDAGPQEDGGFLVRVRLPVAAVRA